MLWFPKLRQWTLPGLWIWTILGSSQLSVHPSCSDNSLSRAGDRRPKYSLEIFRKYRKALLGFNGLSKIILTMFSRFQCRFRKGFNAQHCLLLVIEKWREVLDNGGETAAVLTDLSKTFGYINHNLLIANLMRTVLKKVRLILLILTLEKKTTKDKNSHFLVHWKRYSLGYPTLCLRTTFVQYLYVMRCAIWFPLYNLKNVKNNHQGV